MNINYNDYISKNFFVYQIDVENIAQVFISCKKVDDNHNINSLDIQKITSPTLSSIKVNKNFAYGGSRLASYLPDHQQAVTKAIKSVSFLAVAESHLKHQLINKAIEDGALSSIIGSNCVITDLIAENSLQQDIEKGYKIPEDYMDLKIRGARCMILPGSAQIEAILKDPMNPNFSNTINPILKTIGDFLNGTIAANLVDQEGNFLDKVFLNPGSINLTPDFGKYSKIADMLNAYTPQVLCLSADAGGCSGKVAYTVSGILSGIEACVEQNLCSFDPEVSSITLVGSAGALGNGILEFLKTKGFKNVRICDLQYENATVTNFAPHLLDKLDRIQMQQLSEQVFKITDSYGKISEIKIGEKVIITPDQEIQQIPDSWQVIKSAPDRFTDETLQEKNIIIATTIGREIENSNYNLIAPNTVFFAAHNIALPIGKSGIEIVQKLHKQKVRFIPGQILTLGGALTSRLEACFREHNNVTSENSKTNRTIFPKRLAHEIVRLIIKHVCNYLIQQQHASEWESLLEFGNLTDLAHLQDSELGMSENQKFIPYDLRF